MFDCEDEARGSCGGDDNIRLDHLCVEVGKRHCTAGDLVGQGASALDVTACYDESAASAGGGVEGGETRDVPRTHNEYPTFRKRPDVLSRHGHCCGRDRSRT
jgi:hypothetical protein